MGPDDSEFLFVAEGQTWTFDRRCLDLVLFLADAERTSVGAARASLSDRFAPEFDDDFLQMPIDRGVREVAIPQSARGLS